MLRHGAGAQGASLSTWQRRRFAEQKDSRAAVCKFMYTLDRDQLRWFFDNYLPAEWDADDPYLLPMAVRDPSGLPPTMVMTAEFDPLRDEGVAYAGKLAEAGVTVRHVHVEDQMHGFLLLDRGVARAGELIDELAEALPAMAIVRRGTLWLGP